MPIHNAGASKLSDTVLQVLITHTVNGVQAHCLPMDILTEAPTIEAAVADMVDLIRTQFQYGRDTQNLAAVFVPAAAEYWQKLAHAKPVRETPISFYRTSEHASVRQGYVLQELELVRAKAHP